jgi:hypothetical protein
MTKYSEKFKLMVVKEYQKGKLGLAEKYGMKDSTPIIRLLQIISFFIKVVRNNECRTLEDLILVDDGLTIPSIGVWFTGRKSYSNY